MTDRQLVASLLRCVAVRNVCFISSPAIGRFNHWYTSTIWEYLNISVHVGCWAHSTNTTSNVCLSSNGTASRDWTLFNASQRKPYAKYVTLNPVCHVMPKRRCTYRTPTVTYFVTVQPLHKSRYQLQQPNGAARPHRTVNKCNNRIWQICLRAERINYRLQVTKALTRGSRI
jgi:hypothetical protein